MHDEEPMWRPVGDVTMLTSVTVQSVEFAREHLDTIRDAGRYRLDDGTVARMLRTWHDTSEMNQVFAEQGRRWRQEAKGTRHEGDVVHFCALVAEERGLIDEILTIAQKLRTVTIERLLAKSDLEIGIEALDILRQRQTEAE